MLKYCNGCKRDLEIDDFYSYKKSICKQCVNKKVKCNYCNKEFNSTNLSGYKSLKFRTGADTMKLYKCNNTKIYIQLFDYSVSAQCRKVELL